MGKVRLLIIVVAMLAFFAPAAIADCGDQDADCYIKAMQGKDKKAAMQAVMMLGRIGDPKAVEPLIEVLADKDKYMATGAAYSLSKIGEPAVTALKLATQSKNANVRKYAAHALTQIGTESYKELSTLARDEDASVRVRAYKGLIKLRDKRSAIDGVYGLKDRHRNVKIEAIRLLREIGDPNTTSQLLKYGLSDMSPEVGLETAAVLVSFGPAVVDSLIKGFEGQPDYVRTRTVFILGEVARTNDDSKAGEAKAFLIYLVEGKKLDPKVKIAVVSKLGDIGDPKAIPALAGLLKKIKGKDQYNDLAQATARNIARLQKSVAKTKK